MQQIFSILMTFVLTGVIANMLAQKWQHRNWVNQQKLVRANLELDELKKLVDKITWLADSRNYRARKVCRSIGKVPNDKLDKLRNEYDIAVTSWNELWNSFCVKLTIYADFEGFVKSLEHLQQKFVRSGGLILYCIHNHEKIDIESARAETEAVLNSISGEIFHLSRNLLNLIVSKESVAYSEAKILITRYNLEEISNWNLLKNLFKLPDM